MVDLGRHLLPLLILATSLAGCAGSDGSAARDLRVFAAASLAGPLDEVVAEWNRLHPDTPAQVSYAASSVLANQILEGAGAHVFFSANTRWMDHLQVAGAIEADSRRDLLGGSLVIVAPSVAPFELDWDAGLASAFEGRLALGDPEHVPVGIYARAALQRLGWWDDLEGRVVAASNARAALTWVELGQAAAGVLYATDAAGSDQVTIVARIPAEVAPDIRYPVAVVHTDPSRAHPAAAGFVDHARSVASGARFEKAGFIVLDRISPEPPTTPAP